MNRTKIFSRRGGDPSDRQAFTFVELLVVLAVLGVLLLLLLPAMARTQPDSHAFQCLNNHRQLARAWRMYADDNNDRLMGVIYGTAVFPNDARAPWVQGWLSYDTSSHNTNRVILTEPRYAAIANYAGREARLFQCPADFYVAPVQRSRGWSSRVRSISANIYVGGVDFDSGPVDSAYALVKKWTALVNPKPAETLLLTDEHPDSINDPALWPPQGGAWVDLPANYHDGGAGMAFADGHSEIHRWQASALSFQVKYVTFATQIPAANDPDLLWLRYHTPRKPGMN